MKHDKTIENILAAHADGLIGNKHDMPPEWEAERENASLQSLLAVAELAQAALVPVQPAPDYVRGLGQNLLASMRTGRKLWTRRVRQAALVGAAALGSLVSIASLVGIVIFVLRRWGKALAT